MMARTTRLVTVRNVLTREGGPEIAVEQQIDDCKTWTETRMNEEASDEQITNYFYSLLYS